MNGVEVYFSNTSQKINDFGFPEPLRCLIVGSSGCGKTTLITNIILKQWVFYYRVVIVSKTLYQETYQKLLEDPPKVLLGSRYYPLISGYSEVNEDLYNDLQNSKRVLIIFDDMMLENQVEIGKFFMMGRHRKHNIVFISQNYGKVNRQLIKTNLNYLICFKQPNFYSKAIFKDFLESQMSWDEFCYNTKEKWSKPFGFYSSLV